MVFDAIGRHQGHQAEAAHVVEHDTGAGVGVENDVVMGVVGWPGAVGMDGHTPRHAEMGDQHHAVVELDQNVLGAPFDGGDPAPGEALGKGFGEGHAEIGAALLDPDEGAAHQMGREAAADGFDFGKLGHGGAP